MSFLVLCHVKKLLMIVSISYCYYDNCRIILNLLKLNIQPKAIVEMLKKMCHEAHNRSRRQERHTCMYSILLI